MNAIKNILLVLTLLCSSAVFAFKAGEFESILGRIAQEEKREKAPQEDLDGKVIDAAQKGDAKKLQALLSAGASANAHGAAENWGTPALVCAATAGHDKILEILVSAGANVDAPDTQGVTALIAAASKGRLDMVEILLKAKAKVDLTTCMNNTALHEAALSGHEKVVRALLNARINVRVENCMGKTARDYAREKGYKEIDTLIKNYLEPAGSSASGLTREDYNDKLIAAVMKGDAETVKTCLAAGADVDVTACVDNASYRKTALMIAAERGYAGAVSALVAGGANVNAADDYGWTALFIALDKAHTETVSILLAAGAAQQCDQAALQEFLMSAAYRGNNQIVDLVQDHLKQQASKS